MNAADAAAMLRAGAHAPCCPAQRAGVIALGAMVLRHPEAKNLPSDLLPRCDIVGQLIADANVWRLAFRPDYPRAFIRHPIYVDGNAPTFGMKSIYFPAWHEIKDVIDVGLKIEGHSVPAMLKPDIRDAYAAWRRAQRCAR